MASPSDNLLSSAALREQLTSGLDDLSGAEAHEVFSERLDNFLEAKGIKEAEIISGESDYAPILGEAAFNGLDFKGLEGTGLSLADTRRLVTDEDYRLDMAEKYLTGNEETRIENEYSELDFNPYNPYAPTSVSMSPGGIEKYEQAFRTKEFMHYELRDALNAGSEGQPATFEDFNAIEDRNEWKLSPTDQAAFHQNGGTADLKFVHPDGRELVYDGDTNELVTDDRYMGTYNYVNATTPADKTPGIVESYSNTQTEDSKLHTAYDVDTWVELGNTRADRYENDGELGRQIQLAESVAKGGVNSLGNNVNDIGDTVSDTVDQIGEIAHNIGNAVSDKASQLGNAARDAGDAALDKAGEIGEALTDGLSYVGDAVSDKASQFGGALNDSFNDVKDYGENALEGATVSLKSFFGISSESNSVDNTEAESNADSQKDSSLNPSHNSIDAAHIQKASFETAAPNASGTVGLEDAINMLAEDQKALNATTADPQAFPVRDALNHSDAAQMFQNLHSHGVKTLSAEITPDMTAQDRASELLLAGQEATQEAGIPMPDEQRELETAREHHITHDHHHSYEDDYSMGL